jgi:hypothetical protein
MWDTDAIGRGLALPDLWIHAVQERARTDALAPVLKLAWPRAVRLLHRDLERILPSVKDPALAKRIGLFSAGLRYELDPHDGHVFLLSEDPELERALFHGTRSLPTIRPFALLVHYLTQTGVLSALVFTHRAL